MSMDWFAFSQPALVWPFTQCQIMPKMGPLAHGTPFSRGLIRVLPRVRKKQALCLARVRPTYSAHNSGAPLGEKGPLLRACLGSDTTNTNAGPPYRSHTVVLTACLCTYVPRLKGCPLLFRTHALVEGYLYSTLDHGQLGLTWHVHEGGRGHGDKTRGEGRRAYTVMWFL